MKKKQKKKHCTQLKNKFLLILAPVNPLATFSTNFATVELFHLMLQKSNYYIPN
jgi:hypothetical protein